jgi:hypothetical protein
MLYGSIRLDGSTSHSSATVRLTLQPQCLSHPHHQAYYYSHGWYRFYLQKAEAHWHLPHLSPSISVLFKLELSFSHLYLFYLFFYFHHLSLFNPFSFHYMQCSKQFSPWILICRTANKCINTCLTPRRQIYGSIMCLSTTWSTLAPQVCNEVPWEYPVSDGDYAKFSKLQELKFSHQRAISRDKQEQWLCSPKWFNLR